MIDSSKYNKEYDRKKDEKDCPCVNERRCISKCDKLSYNNKNCCYLQSKDINIVQVNDPTLFQIITSYDNLYLTAIPLEINTSEYEIESSSIQRPNDTLVVNGAGVYSIYFSLKYSFKFNENAIDKDIFTIGIQLRGNDEEILTVNDTIIVPNIVDGQSEEIVKTIQGSKLQVIKEDEIYNINMSLNEFNFDITVLNQIVISDLILIVEKII